MGYLTGSPGVCLVVSGPGVIHAMAGMVNAQENCWPLLVIGGSSDQNQEGRGAFQEYPQVDICRSCTKYSARPSTVSNIPFVIEKAVRTCLSGRPGVCYVDLPGDMITAQTETADLSIPSRYPGPPRPLAEPERIQEAVRLMRRAKCPLVVIGKGAASARAEHPIQTLMHLTGFPFLPSPMGKGVIADDHQQCVAAARSTALSQSDVILLLGARLNWMLHFGLPPRFRADVKLIQVDIHGEELGNNVQAAVGLQGDLQSVSKQLCNEWVKSGEDNRVKTEYLDLWWTKLKTKSEANRQKSKELSDLTTIPMNYYQVFGKIKQYVDRNTYIISEGANTMDIGRTMLENSLPRHRLDAGTFGTMGVGIGFAIAAAMYVREGGEKANGRRVVCIEGDSAFGFSGMEYETACRAPPTALLPDARYDKLASVFGGHGYFVTTPSELSTTLQQVFSHPTSQPVIINVIIDPTSDRKTQEFFWLTKSSL
ncbi:2-hydroxyacyl-CoA lyase 1-like isoform X1 [Corticium candelabrum]|uniref:2-hydroxyacyl-CoA lyase 1-like isoform X1 n=1 Tax=Corticium candelabrum TaxID=121492 RepID=UPI002E26A34E|nr:2-hydroxyacyl-CoA lyase 1-like isoform X1 [Corticium candelabrum]